MMRPGGGESFEASSRRPLKMRVQPAGPSVKPWLPADQISLRARIQSSERAEAGKPLRLTIDLTAAGTTGTSLPSLEEQLQTSGFRVYREKTHTESKLSKDGRRLLGRRLESFTVVPQYSGELQLPALRLAWWNVRTGAVRFDPPTLRHCERRKRARHPFDERLMRSCRAAQQGRRCEGARDPFVHFTHEYDSSHPVYCV